ncbi:hypothetical protein H0H93_011561 [Arthromyces matolae]|nr:hypothetical protein H0H93_011561 [Arthromyces matolae]
MSSLKDLVDEWLRMDQNPTTSAQIQDLWEAGDLKELESRMSPGLLTWEDRLDYHPSISGQLFGFHVGLNFTVEAQGLCAYVLENVSDASRRGVVIGHDHRYNSERWAQLTAAAFISKGVKVYLLQGLVHTPFSLNGAMNVKFVNTSMHGVSDSFVSEAFTAFGFAAYIPVVEQQQPDPEFPTDLALRTAERHGAGYVLAQDPDSDRFAAAEREYEKNPTRDLILNLSSSVDGRWTTFTGDQLGVLFGHLIFQSYKVSGKPLERLAMVASTVSSKMLETIAKVEGFKFVECLTGFKFIGNTALNLVEEGYEVPFGYEEAIGYMFGSDIRDKDGVAATVVFAEMVTTLHAQKLTVNSYLQSLYARYGYFQTSNSYFICADPVTIDKIFSRIRSYRMIKYYLEGYGKNADSVAALLPRVVVELGDVWLEAGKNGLLYA